MRVRRKGVRQRAGLTELYKGFDRNVPFARRLPIIIRNLRGWASVILEDTTSTLDARCVWYQRYEKTTAGRRG